MLVNRVVTENKNEISTWIYENYGTSLPAKLRYLSFDSDILLKEMSQKIISLEEALAWDAFQKEKKKEDMEEIYQLISLSGKSVEEVKELLSR